MCRSFPNFQNAYRTLIAALGQTGETAEAQGVMAEDLRVQQRSLEDVFVELTDADEVAP